MCVGFGRVEDPIDALDVLQGLGLPAQSVLVVDVARSGLAGGEIQQLFAFLHPPGWNDVCGLFLALKDFFPGGS